MHKNRVSLYYWSRYRIPTQMPKFDGPAPVAAPQNMNSTKTNEFIDPIDDKFPVSIRGNMCRPDVPEDQYVDSWYVCTSMTHHLGDYKPWSSSAPPNAYRFRPYNEFDAKGREYVKQFREFRQFDADNRHNKEAATSFPFREAYLTKMSPAPAARFLPSKATALDRIVEESHGSQVLGPLEVQRDVGRIENPLPCAGKIEVDGSFPFQWDTEDWYEFEVSKVRCKRFKFTNSDSEVTYRIVLEGLWDHHVSKLAEDACMFLRDVGRDLVDEKLQSIRRTLQDLQSGTVDPDLLAAFRCQRKGPFGGPDEYSQEEVVNFLRADLQKLEEECVQVINRCNIPIPAASNIYDPNASWPFVEKLEPWVRMAEFWSSSSDTSFTELEMSTSHYEFRKFFRVIVVKLPFQSSEFEQRMYSMRHWLHRQTSAEFHTTYRRNVVHDEAVFPTEHDPQLLSNHNHHRLFSFALDWKSTPVGFLSKEAVAVDDTWESVALRLGCSVMELKEANDYVDALEGGMMLSVPVASHRRLSSSASVARVLPLRKEGSTITTWEEAGQMLGCSVEELQQANSEATVSYSSEKGFDAKITELRVPDSVVSGDAFASTEPVYSSDTLGSIAKRLQCTMEALKEANPEVNDTHPLECQYVKVPPTAKAPRRIIHPQLRSQASTDALFPRTIMEQSAAGIDHIPNLPANSDQFPHEYHTPTSRFPPTPKEMGFNDNWLSYTATYLDPHLGVKDEPTPLYNVNKLWPFQQVPGKVDQTPFEEDQTWLMHPIPVQQMSLHHPEKDLQDLPFVNHEQFPRSIEWTAP